MKYQENFEETDPVSFWTNGGKGDYRINFKGLTTERSHSGEKSFKLDITFLKDGIFSYWAGPTLDIPAVPGMRMTGHFYVEQNPGASLGLGTSFYSEAVALRDGNTGRGMCQVIDQVGRKTVGQWIKQEADLDVMGRTLNKGEPYPDARLDKWYIHISCAALENARLVLYVDDITIEGDVPSDWEAEAQRKTEAWLASFEANKRDALEAFERKLVPVRDEVNRLLDEIPDASALSRVPSQPWGPYARQLHQAIRAKADELVEATAPGREDLPTVPMPVSDKPQEYLRGLRDGGTRPLETSIENLDRLASWPDPCLVFVADEPVTNYRILPTTRLMNGLLTDELSLFAAPGEYEPATFVLLPARETTVTFELSDLRSGDDVIGRDALDLKVVKVWYQGGIHHTPSGKSILTPELLLNDDRLVTLDEANERNIVRDIDAPRDAAELLPVDIPAMTAKQFWLTVHVPEDAAPGEYTGTILMKADGLVERSLKVVLQVLPIELADPELEFSIYFRSTLVENPPPYVNSDDKTPAQLAAEFRNLKAHGITNPDVYQKFGSPLLDQYMDLREEAGLKSSPLYFLGKGAGSYKDPEKRARHVEKIREVLAWARGRGIQTVYFHGSDEARGEELRAQRETWKAVREAGGKIFVATSTGFFELVGDLLDLPIVARESPEDVPRVHALGHKIHYYSNPAGATEQPYTFRYKFGHWLDRSGMDGVHTYVYQHGQGPGKDMGRMWDDFDYAKYRTLAFTYPTVDRVVDTLQWEGVREGVDDLRYVTTLGKAIDAARKRQSADAVQRANEAESWLAEVDIEGDLMALRWKIAQMIIALNGTP